MSELREWLRRNKFEQYADAFEANDIGLDILPELSERDLEQLGVSLGNRRRLLKAIAEGAGTIAQPKAAEARAPETSADAERRQVTVLFCDMVGSTALSGAVDPELLGSLIRRYQDAAAGAIGRFGGFVAKFMGDGVLAYFGFPHAFEDAAERAVRAAIGILTEVGNIERPDGTPAAGARRHRDGTGRRRRDCRHRHRARAHHRRRNTESCRAASGTGGARYDPHQRDDAEFARRIVQA